MKRLEWILLLLCLPTMGFAQYNPSKIFVPNFYQHNGNNFRSASGKPGAAYWQNQADYSIKAEFDTATNILKGQVLIDYTNNSPDELNALWLQLDQNIDKENSRGNLLRNLITELDTNKGFKIHDLKMLKEGKWQTIPYLVDDTRMQVRLDKSIKPNEEIELNINYSYQLQPKGGGWRSGYVDTENGKIYEFSYWYPRMCVYDDYYGWNTLPFVGGGEMYLDYGTINYQLTVPANQLVVGSGILMNEKEILNTQTLNRLTKARSSDSTVMIRKATELNQNITKGNKTTLSWHFNMKNTRDVAWAMSSAFLWDAAKINLPSGKTALAQSVYPIASIQNDYAWSRSTEMIKASVEDFSKRWFEYPYAVATSVAGPVGGMEFPGLAFNYWKVKADILFLLASHEIGHTWYPMIVGSDERRHPFMDEGFNTFIDVYAQKDFNQGEFAPKRDGEYAPGGGNPADEIIKVIEECKEGPTLMTPADGMESKFVHPLAYFKSAFGLVLLREVILGHDKFDYAFKQYTKNWAYKHPRPEDFFRSMDNASGENLTWFWQGWYHHNWQLDQAIDKVEYKDGKAENGATIFLSNKQQMVMPLLLKVEENNGKIQEFKVPVEIWTNGGTIQLPIQTTSKIKKIELDVNHQLPDVDRTNNSWKGE